MVIGRIVQLEQQGSEGRVFVVRVLADLLRRAHPVLRARCFATSRLIRHGASATPDGSTCEVMPSASVVRMRQPNESCLGRSAVTASTVARKQIRSRCQVNWQPSWARAPAMLINVEHT